MVVSICMITYNHGPFIAQAIEGALMQKTNFPVELVIGEDCSTDRTREICLSFKEKYPDIIKLNFPHKNMGVMNNFKETFRACTGKYIALCEGDDYWTDPYKLQKQVDFLETNPEYSITSHRYRILDEENQKFSLDFAYELFNENIEGLNFDKNTFLDYQFNQTMTVVFRREFCDFNLFLKLNQGDIALFYCCLINGLGYCFNFDGAVYRRHVGGVYSKIDEYEKIRRKFYIHRSLFKNTSDNLFKKHYESHYELLLGQVKEHIGKIDSRVRKDIYSILHDDFVSGNTLLLIIHIRKIITWKLKSFLKSE